MASTNDIRPGQTLDIEGTLFTIINYQHVKPGKGGAFVRTKVRRVEDGSVIDKTFRAGEKFRPVRTETRKMHALEEYGLMHVKLYEDIARHGRIATAYAYPVKVEGRYVMDPSPTIVGMVVALIMMPR